MKFLLEFDRKSIRTGSLITLHCIFAKVISHKISREKSFFATSVQMVRKSSLSKN